MSKFNVRFKPNDQGEYRFQFTEDNQEYVRRMIKENAEIQYLSRRETKKADVITIYIKDPPEEFMSALHQAMMEALMHNTPPINLN